MAGAGKKWFSSAFIPGDRCKVAEHIWNSQVCCDTLRKPKLVGKYELLVKQRVNEPCMVTFSKSEIAVLFQRYEISIADDQNYRF